MLVSTVNHIQVHLHTVHRLRVDHVTLSCVTMVLTSTLGPGPERRPGVSRAPLQGPGQQHADLILGVRVKMADLMGALIHRGGVNQHPGHGAVLHLEAQYYSKNYTSTTVRTTIILLLELQQYYC